MRSFLLYTTFFTLTFLLFSCSSSKSLYNFEYPLSGETTGSAGSHLTVSVPSGWYVAQEELYDIWLVKNDLSNSISFQLLSVDDQTKTELKQNPIHQIISFSKTFRKAAPGKNYTELNKDEIFSLNGRLFGAYEYKDKSNNQIRVVVFEYNGQYYEVTTAVGPSVKPEDTVKIFAVQNSVLKSIK